ncbi:MAG TPA: TMEM165/GDT1 family protein [Thermoplasmata archaeon]|nr:TMEM165/GDT1 family protein [Thermoplasmata archaeon]
MDLAFLSGFLVVFAVTGGFELFDRTSFAIIALASRHPPVASWAGAAVAFVVSTAIAVSVGATLVALLGPGRVGLVRAGAGTFLIGYALWLWYRGPEEGAEGATSARTALLAAFATVLLLELGDTTMIIEVLFVTTYGWLVVFAAGALALASVAAWAAWLGGRLGARVEPMLLHRIVVVILLVVGALTIAYGLAPSAFPALSVASPT